MYAVYDSDTGEELYRISEINEENFKNTMEIYSEKFTDGKLIKETKVKNIAYRKIN